MTAGAVCLAESGGNYNALNDTPRTGDLSYGLWQINMIGSLGPARRKHFGLELNGELFTPSVNAHAAYTLYRDAGRRFTDWSTYKHRTHVQFMARMARAVTTLNSGGEPPVPLVAEFRRHLYLRHPFMTGSDVKIVQRKSGCKDDGIFGPITRGHVVAYQHAHGLTADGIVGPLTVASYGPAYRWVK